MTLLRINPWSIVIFASIVMVSLTGGLYLTALLAPENLDRATVSGIQMGFANYMIVSAAVASLVLVPIVHRSYAGSFHRLKTIFLSVWAMCFAISIPLTLTPLMSLISACMLGAGCKGLDLMNVLPEQLLLLVAPIFWSFWMGCKFAFVYGWYLLARDLFDLHRGGNPILDIPPAETPAFVKSGPRTQFGLRQN